MKLEVPRHTCIFEKAQISSLIKVRPVGAELFHAGGQTDMAKVITAGQLWGPPPPIRRPRTLPLRPYLTVREKGVLLYLTYVRCHLFKYILSKSCGISSYRKRSFTSPV